MGESKSANGRKIVGWRDENGCWQTDVYVLPNVNLDHLRNR